MPLENIVYRIGFNGNDETEFDIEPGTEESEMAELMSLFEDFLAENPDIIFKEINYIERVS
jgi:hypothetical protein